MSLHLPPFSTNHSGMGVGWQMIKQKKKREIDAENGPWAPKAEGGLGVQVSGAGGAVATASGS